MAEPVYLYGYGSRKHIADPDSVPDRWGERRALCNADGRPEQDWRRMYGDEDRSVCKRCGFETVSAPRRQGHA